jgi:competence ComEA-like helix-hairpin-helix protein
MSSHRTTVILACAIIGFFAAMHFRISTAKDDERRDFRLRSFADTEEARGAGKESASPGKDSPQKDAATARRKISINECTAQDIMNVDGFGEKMSQRIIDRRKELGGFLTVEDMLDIPGIGEKRLAALKECFIIPAQEKAEPSSVIEDKAFSSDEACPFCRKLLGSDRRKQRTSYIYCPHCLKYLPEGIREKSL